MQISFESNLRQVERDLSDVARRQVPFATSLALNDLVQEIQKEETERLDRVLDRPTPFTRKAYAVRRSTKASLAARVYAKPIQAAYLATLEEGGTKTPKGRALVLPQRLRVNAYGNLPKGTIRRQLSAPATFSGTPKGGRGGPGIYKRQRGRLIKLISYTARARYAPRLGFHRSAERIALARFPALFEAALVRAFASRR